MSRKRARRRAASRRHDPTEDQPATAPLAGVGNRTASRAIASGHGPTLVHRLSPWIEAQEQETPLGPDGDVEAGDAGHTRLLLQAVGEVAPGVVDSLDTNLQPVSFDRNCVEPQIRRRQGEANYWAEQRDGWNSSFSRETYANWATFAQNDAARIEEQGDEMTEWVNRFNASVPAANGVYADAARLSVAQHYLGATSSEQLATDLMVGLEEVGLVARAYQQSYGGGTTGDGLESLDIPEEDGSVEAATERVSGAYQELSTAYIGLRQVALEERRADVHAEGDDERAELAEIEQVKQFLRNVGSTIDAAMAVTGKMPSLGARASGMMHRTRAELGARRNRARMARGQRENRNPTYLTTDSQGNATIGNAQTGQRRNAESGEREDLPSYGSELRSFGADATSTANAALAPVDLSIPTSAADIMGTIGELAYAEQVGRLQRTLETIKARCDALAHQGEMQRIRRLTETFSDALDAYNTAMADLERHIRSRQSEYFELGVQLDRFARAEASLETQGLSTDADGERYTLVLAATALVRQVVSSARLGQRVVPDVRAFEGWWLETARQRGLGTPYRGGRNFTMTEGEAEAALAVGQQAADYRARVDMVLEMFGGVDAAAIAALSDPGVTTTGTGEY